MQPRREIRKIALRTVWTLGLALGLCLPGFAGTYGAFGPETYVRVSGGPDVITRTFTAVDPAASYTLRIDNGGGSGQLGTVSSAIVTLNGVNVVSTSDFNQNVQVIEKTVHLASQNQLKVDLRGAPQSGFKLVILGIDDIAPTITATLDPPANAAGWNKTDVTVRFSCADERSGVGFCPDSVVVSREGGGQVVSGTVFDLASNRANVVVTVNVDKTAPVVAFTSPPAGQATNGGSVLARATASDANGVTAAALNGVGVTVVDGAFERLVPVAEGSNTLVATARDVADNAGSATLGVVRFSLPVVTVLSPAPETLTAAPTIQVSGTVTAGVSAVEVNGVAGAVSGTGFTAANVPLFEGNNLLTVVATDGHGRSGTASVQVIRDSTAPRVAIHAPTAGSVTTAAAVTVSGMVNDLIIGSLDPQEAEVTVNGVHAEVANRSFVAANVPLAVGDNTITATARDLSGNVGTASAVVRRLDAAGQASIAAVTGDLQEGVIGTALPGALVVSVVDGFGNPLPNRQVAFRVVENNGTLANIAGSGPSVMEETDAQGRARTTWTLGTRAGAGKNRVEATSPGIAGVAVFTATGLPAAGARISVDAGNLQYGVAGEELPRPFVAVVTDGGNNRIAGVPVTFRVVAGSSSFGGQQTATAETDAYGRALVPFTLGPEPGQDNNVVEATFAGNEGNKAVFAASGRVAGDPAATSISGVVLDNTNVPVQGVTIKVEDTNLVTRTDAQGQFKIAGAPVGRVRLVVDGSTAQRPGSWPSLQYEMVTVPGQDNNVGMPIFLLPIDLPHGVFIDETHGGTLTLDAMPGFSLNIAPGSATFPGGGRSGVVSVTLVHSDKVPMIPNFGQQPRFIVTIQPAGTRFDPPAAMTMPNVDGLRPGEITEMYSFDHDLGMFVSIGTATVSADGMVLRSDPGVGVIEGGWHCGGNPSAAGGAQNASVTINTADPYKMKKNDTATIAASGGPQPGTYSWSTDKPDVVSFQGPTSGPDVSSVPIKALKGGTAKVKVTYTCESGASDTDEIKVNVAGPDVVVVAWVDAGPPRAALQTLENEAGWYIKLDLNTIACNPTIGLWTLGVHIDLLTEGDRKYANAFLLANSGNNRPPQTINPEAVQAGGDYRLFGRYQVAIEDISGPVVTTIQQASNVGHTPNPCGWGPTGAPDIHPENGRNGLTSSRSAAYNLTEGRLGSLGQAANTTVNGHSTPWIWNVIRFNLDALLDPRDIDHAIFPTYTLYEDGQQVNNFPQADHEQFIALGDTYQRHSGEVP